MAERRATIASIAVAALLAGCHQAPEGNVTAPAPPPANAAMASPHAARSSAAAAVLDDYVGHYPFNAVGGVRFLDQPAVRHAVATLVPDAAIRALMLGGTGPGAPIAIESGKLVAWSCETHNCGDHNWSIVIGTTGGDAAICYHDAATTAARSRWYLAPGRSELRSDDCPSG